MAATVFVALAVANAVVLVARLGGAGGDGASAAVATVPAGHEGGEDPAALPTTAGREHRGSGRSVTLAFGGDVHFEGAIGTTLRRRPAAVLAGVRDVLSAADVAMVNLETAVTTGGSPSPKTYNFRAPASAFQALRAGGVDVATMANNHGMDYGIAGLEDSLDAAAQASFPVVGIGRDADEAYRPHVVEVKGQRIAFFGATQVLDDDLAAAWTATPSKPGLASAKDEERMAAAVRAARGEVDTIVVFLHWGTERMTCPNEVQPRLARVLADAGADVVVGTHAHRLQGAGMLEGTFVAYGLGNFVFYSSNGPGTESGVLTVEVTGRVVERYEWTPARLVGGLPRTLGGAAGDTARRQWDSLRGCTGLRP